MLMMQSIKVTTVTNPARVMAVLEIVMRMESSPVKGRHATVMQSMQAHCAI